MSDKNKNQSDAASEPATPEQPAPPSRGYERPRRCGVLCTRSFAIGGKMVAVGTKLAEVEFAPGVDLNILVDAVRSGLAGEPPSRL